MNMNATHIIVDGVRTPIGILRRRARERARRRPGRARDPRAGRASAVARSGARSPTWSSAARTRPARTTATSRAWRLLLAGLPVSVPGRDGQPAVRLGAERGGARRARRHARRGRPLRRRRRGEHDARAVRDVEGREAVRRATSQLFDTSLGWRFVNPRMQALYGMDSMGQTAENVAEQYGDLARGPGRVRAALAAEGRRGARARPVRARDRAGRRSPQRKREHGRASTATSSSAPTPRSRGSRKLTPAFRTDGRGSVTAGNSSGINDGACALLVASETARQRASALTPLRASSPAAAAGVEPRIMGIGPVPATRLVLARAGLDARRRWT